ncbi:MAG: LPS export ABC transporter permease LptF [Sulfuricaulis sp.]
MIINRAFYREAAVTTIGIAVVLLIVMTMMNLTLLLGRAVRGGTSESVLYILLGYQMLGKIDILLPLAFYLGVLLTLSRWYRDSEMTVLAACGVGLTHFLRPVMLIGMTVGLVVLVASFYATPLAQRQIEKVKAESSQRTEPGKVAPGVFTESPGTGRIFYAEKIRGNGELERVFVSSLEEDGQGVLVAKSGYPFTDAKTGDKFVALKEGTLYEGEPGAANYRILEFGVYNLRIEPKLIDEPEVPMSGLPNMSLLGRLGNPEANAELHWRLGKTIVLFVLALFAMAFAYTDVRRGRMSNFFVAIVIYFVYSNLLGIGETMLQNGSIPAALGLWWIHGGMGLVAAYLLWQRQCNRPLFVFSMRSRRA